MNQLFYGSFDVTKIIEEAKKKHSGFTKAQNNHIYASVQIWLNDEKDKYGNVMSVKIIPSKENKDTEQGFYIGNLKKSDGPKPIGENDTEGLSLDEIDPLPTQSVKSDISTENDQDLPF